MKKLILITGFILAFTQMKSQGNLQFNQVLTFSEYIYMGSSQDMVVPQGKVWKVEDYTRDFLHFNGVRISDNTTNLGVIWLKSGDVLNYNTSYCNGCSVKYIVSIIEFNVIP